jgi:hypothetical protein
MADIDPTRSTSPELGRRPFLKVSAGVIAAGTSVARVIAADKQLGKPHPPLVPEDDPAITVERATLNTAEDAWQRTLTWFNKYLR